jgi:hypothetical protein
LNDRSPLRRFVTASRDFGVFVAIKVTYSKIRGRLFPALALPDAPVYGTRHREVSILLGTAEHGVATLCGVVELLARRGGSGWEVCICERSPVEAEMAHALARMRGTQPWIRIVTVDESVDDATASRWTVEQATGQFVALVAPGYVPEADAIAVLVTRLHDDAGTNAAALVGAGGGLEEPASPPPPAGYRLVLQRKSGYLAALPEFRRLTAPALAEYLDAARVPTACIVASDGEPG